MDGLKINKKILTQIIKLILDYKKPEKIMVFGSRASGACSDTSDIDIAVFGKDWVSRDVNIVRYTLDEYVKTPLKFDVLNFYAITKDKLKENILKKGRLIYGPGKD